MITPDRGAIARTLGEVAKRAPRCFALDRPYWSDQYDRMLEGRPLVEQIVPQLENLFSSSASSGQKLPSERSLCEKFAVSRPIVREALRSLQQRGLIEIRPGRGIFAVQNLSVPAIRVMRDWARNHSIKFAELYEGRMLLETHVAEMAARRRTKDDVTALSNNLERMTENVDNPSEFEKADLEFHIALSRATKNQLYCIWLEPIISLLEGQRQRLVILGKVRRRVLAAHFAIFEAVKKREPIAARKAMAQHLNDFATHTELALRLGLLPAEDLVVTVGGSHRGKGTSNVGYARKHDPTKKYQRNGRRRGNDRRSS